MKKNNAKFCLKNPKMAFHSFGNKSMIKVISIQKRARYPKDFDKIPSSGRRDSSRVSRSRNRRVSRKSVSITENCPILGQRLRVFAGVSLATPAFPHRLRLTATHYERQERNARYYNNLSRGDDAGAGDDVSRLQCLTVTRNQD